MQKTEFHIQGMYACKTVTKRGKKSGGEGEQWREDSIYIIL